jgi:FMN phosphatase YigB (HAD superfamily)
MTLTTNCFASALAHIAKAFCIRVGIVSHIHYDIRPLFEHCGLTGLVHTFTLSFERGWQKSDPCLSEIALEALGAQPTVGDRANRDGGAASVGVATLILPDVPTFMPRGLHVVLRLTGCS